MSWNRRIKIGDHVYWNHRVMKSTHGEETIYTIREVYYDHDGSIEGWTADAVAPQGETPEELREELARMIACTAQGVLYEAVLEEKNKGELGALKSLEEDLGG